MPSSQVATFTDPVPYQEAMRGAELQAFPTAKGKFHAELTKVALNRVWMQRAHEALPKIFVGSVSPDRQVIGFLTRANQPAMQHRGVDATFGQIVVNDSDLMHRRTSSHCDWGTMSLPYSELDAACLAIAGREYSRSLPPIIRPVDPVISRFIRLHELTADIAKSFPSLLSLPEVTRALDNSLVHLMVRCLLVESDGSGTKLGDIRHKAVVARFEEFLESNCDRPIYLTEICATIGVAERTLRTCCEEHLGMGPIRYLWLRRMHLTRRALLRAEPASTTITKVATDHGFWELGKFAVAYRNLFGETPSQSLRRTPDMELRKLNRPSSLPN